MAIDYNSLQASMRVAAIFEFKYWINFFKIGNSSERTVEKPQPSIKSPIQLIRSGYSALILLNSWTMRSYTI